jgi:hypothetical protein
VPGLYKDQFCNGEALTAFITFQVRKHSLSERLINLPTVTKHELREAGLKAKPNTKAHTSYSATTYLAWMRC